MKSVIAAKSSLFIPQAATGFPSEAKKRKYRCFEIGKYFAVKVIDFSF